MKTLAALLLLFLGPVGCSLLAQRVGAQPHWSQARWAASGLAPDPAEAPEAIVQVYAARTWGWKAAFAVHSWIVVKEPGAAEYERFEVVGWGVNRGLPAVRRNLRPPDGYWAGNRPEIVAERRGPEAAALIPKIKAAVASYPWPDRYLTWPGPNSNSFVAHVLRQVPELGAELPPTAIGKDFVGAKLLAPMPSGTGHQISLLGLLGIGLAIEEGLELNVLGLVIGLDRADLAIKLPGIGTIGLRVRSTGSEPSRAVEARLLEGQTRAPPRPARSTTGEPAPSFPRRTRTGDRDGQQESRGRGRGRGDRPQPPPLARA